MPYQAHELAAIVGHMNLVHARQVCESPHQPVECTGLFNQSRQQHSSFNQLASCALLFPDGSVLAFFQEAPAKPYNPDWNEVFANPSPQRRLAAAYCGND